MQTLKYTFRSRQTQGNTDLAKSTRDRHIYVYIPPHTRIFPALALQLQGRCPLAFGRCSSLSPCPSLSPLAHLPLYPLCSCPPPPAPWPPAASHFSLHHLHPSLSSSAPTPCFPPVTSQPSLSTPFLLCILSLGLFAPGLGPPEAAPPLESSQTWRPGGSIGGEKSL